MDPRARNSSRPGRVSVGDGVSVLAEVANVLSRRGGRRPRADGPAGGPAPPCTPPPAPAGRDKVQGAAPSQTASRLAWGPHIALLRENNVRKGFFEYEHLPDDLKPVAETAFVTHVYVEADLAMSPTLSRFLDRLVES